MINSKLSMIKSHGDGVSVRSFCDVAIISGLFAFSLHFDINGRWFCDAVIHSGLFGLFLYFDINVNFSFAVDDIK